MAKKRISKKVKSEPAPEIVPDAIYEGEPVEEPKQFYKPKKILTRKQEVFVSNYLTRFNVREAAKAAGVSHGQGLNYLNADRFPQIKAEIDRVLMERKARNEVTVDRVVEELAKIGFMDYRKLFDEDGNLVKARDLPDEVAGAVSRIRIRKKSSLEGGEAVIHEIADIDFHDKIAALNTLAKHLGIGRDSDPKSVSLTQVNWTQILTSAGAVAPPDPAAEKIKLLEMATRPGCGEVQSPEFAQIVHKPGNGSSAVPVDPDKIPADIIKAVAGSDNDTSRVVSREEYRASQQK